MKPEQLFVIALIVIAVLASIPQIPVSPQVWGAILAILGILAGVMLNYAGLAQRTVIYVLALAIPAFDNCLDAIWVIGPWLNMLLDHVAMGIQGMAVGLFAMALLDRLQGKPLGAAS